MNGQEHTKPTILDMTKKKIIDNVKFYTSHLKVDANVVGSKDLGAIKRYTWFLVAKFNLEYKFCNGLQCHDSVHLDANYFDQCLV